MTLLICHHRMVFIAIFSLSINFCSLSGESTFRDTSEIYDDSKTNSEEINRRRNLVEPHLLEIAEKQKDWIETYHMSFSTDEIISRKKVISDNHVLMNDPVQSEVHPIGATDKPLKQENSAKDIHNQRMNFDSNKEKKSTDYSDKSKYMASKTSPLNPEERKRRHKIVHEFLPELKNLEMGIETNLINSTSMNQKTFSHNSAETKNMAVSDKIKRHAKEDISMNKLVDTPSLEPSEINKDRTSAVEKNMKTDDVLFNNFEIPHSVDSNDKSSQNSKKHLLQHKIKDSSFSGSSGSYEGEAERNLLFDHVENLKIFSNDKIKVTEHPLGLSKIYFDHSAAYHCLSGNMKENFLCIIKELTDLKKTDSDWCDASRMYNTPHEKKHEADYPIYKEEKVIQVEFEKYDALGSTEKLHSVSEELNPRKKHVKSFLSSLDKGKQNWKETYHFSYEETESEEVFNSEFGDVLKGKQKYISADPSEVKKSITNVVEPVRIQDRLYFNRWLNKLLNKLVNHPYTELVNIHFSFTTHSINELKKLSTSEKYDINYVDELISDLISNATLHYNYDSSASFALFSSVILYVIISIVLITLFYFILLYYPVFRIILFFLACILWHGYKMYQEKVAEKHATVSGSSPAYCESILNKESGVFAHIKEIFRYNTYDDHCKKYFAAIMIDPISELSLSIVVSDFVSSTFFQIFRPMGRALNVLVKDLFYDLSFLQAFYLIILLIFIFILSVSLTLICCRYRLNFPFFMGSVEPSIAPSGSRVEDIALEPNVKKESPLQLIVTESADISLIYHTKHSVSPKLQNDHQPKISLSLARRYSF